MIFLTKVAFEGCCVQEFKKEVQFLRIKAIFSYQPTDSVRSIVMQCNDEANFNDNPMVTLMVIFFNTIGLCSYVINKQAVRLFLMICFGNIKTVVRNCAAKLR